MTSFQKASCKPFGIFPFFCKNRQCRMTVIMSVYKVTGGCATYPLIEGRYPPCTAVGAVAVGARLAIAIKIAPMTYSSGTMGLASMRTSLLVYVWPATALHVWLGPWRSDALTWVLPFVWSLSTGHGLCLWIEALALGMEGYGMMLRISAGWCADQAYMMKHAARKCPATVLRGVGNGHTAIRDAAAAASAPQHSSKALLCCMVDHICLICAPSSVYIQWHATPFHT